MTNEKLKELAARMQQLLADRGEGSLTTEEMAKALGVSEAEVSAIAAEVPGHVSIVGGFVFQSVTRRT